MLPIVEKIAEYSVAPVVQQFGYLIRYKSNVVHLTDQVQQLCNKRDGVNMEVEPARKALMRIDPGVESWLEEVQKIMEEKETRFKEESVATKATCCNGWFPNLKGRYSLGRKAQKMTLAVADLLARDLGTIVHPAPHPEVEFQPRGASSSGTSNHIPQPTFTGRTIDFESRRSTITDVMEALKGNQVSAIVICGMGGIGKTTLVNEVINKAKIEGIFDEYTKAVVTETPNRGNIQRDLAEYLGLPLTEEGLEARADKLRKRLSDATRVLVVLDNVWTNLDLWKIGIPCNPKSCKILVTSRNQDVFNEIEETRKKFPIGVLPESEAWNLFKKVAGDYIESDLELRSIAKQVLRECDGLPVAISTLGSALRQKTKPVWKDALGQLQKPFRGDIRGMKDNVYQTIRLSYDFVEREEAKSCFMLCCVYPESTDILIEDLVTHGLGLGLFQGIDSVEGGRDRVEALLDTLRSCYLLLDTDKKKRVRMHDVVRAVGLYIASDESGRGGTFLVRHGVALEGWPQRYTCSSLIVTANKSSPELLFLSGTDEEKRSSLEIPDTLDGVEDLKVLDLSVPSGLITSFPGMRRRRPRLTSLSVLLRNIQTLCLKNLELELQAISVIGELRTLMILRLSGSTIRHVPEEFKYLCNLKLLDLTDCWKLEISPGIISSLSKLEELNLWGSFDKWDDAGMMPVSEILDLPLLTSLETHLPPVVDILRNSMLLFDKLQNFKLAIQERKVRRTFEEHQEMMLFTKFPGDKNLMLENLDADSLVAVTGLLKKTDALWLEMASLVHPLNVLAVDCVANLKNLTVRKCHALEYLVDLTRRKSSPVFPILDALQIQGARRLKEIFHGLLPVGSLKQLGRLLIHGAPVLSHVWNMETHFARLEFLKLNNCKSLEVVVTWQELGHHDEEEANLINFPNLTHLHLENLPSLVGISSKKVCKPNFPRLLKLQLQMLPKFVGLMTSSSNEVAVQHLLDPKVFFFSR